MHEVMSDIILFLKNINRDRIKSIHMLIRNKYKE